MLLNNFALLKSTHKTRLYFSYPLIILVAVLIVKRKHIPKRQSHNIIHFYAVLFHFLMSWFDIRRAEEYRWMGNFRRILLFHRGFGVED